MAIETVSVKDASDQAQPIAADKIGSDYYQVVKLAFGADGAAFLVEAGTPLPVALSAPVALDAAALAALESITVGGEVSLSAGSLAALESVTVGGNVELGATSLAALESVTAAGPLTDEQLRANPVPTASAAGQVIDAVFDLAKSLNVGGGIRRDADTSPVSADGDVHPFTFNQTGRLKVSVHAGAMDQVTGTVTTSTSTVACDTARASNVMVAISGTYAGVNLSFEGTLDGTNWGLIQAIRADANTIVTATGVLTANSTNLYELSVNGLTQCRVRATAWTSGTANIRFQPAPFATEPIPAAQVSATQPVSFTQPALVAGTAQIGDVGIAYRANNTGAAGGAHIVAAASTNATIVKASAGRVVGWHLSNPSAAWKYVKLHNQATSPTAGTGVVRTIGIPPGGNSQANYPGGVGFAAGIGLTIVTGSADADATAVAAGDVVGDLFFA